ncbi:MAG: type II toxin-antitoxin system RelE/ParE family toxin [Bacteroidaceae bacterium]|nr:type II toxin-antitoxin system RelE/ParE family toxin [Bacteroidaceae bacterium]
MMRIVFTTDFKTAYKRLKKKYSSFDSDFRTLMRSLTDKPEQGVELFDGIRKIRLNIKSKGKGKSGGARIIIRVQRINDVLAFLFVYDKSEMENVRDEYLRDIIKRNADIF